MKVSNQSGFVDTHRSVSIASGLWDHVISALLTPSIHSVVVPPFDFYVLLYCRHAALVAEGSRRLKLGHKCMAEHLQSTDTIDTIQLRKFILLEPKQAISNANPWHCQTLPVFISSRNITPCHRSAAQQARSLPSEDPISCKILFRASECTS